MTVISRKRAFDSGEQCRQGCQKSQRNDSAENFASQHTTNIDHQACASQQLSHHANHTCNHNNITSHSPTTSTSALFAGSAPDTLGTGQSTSPTFSSEPSIQLQHPDSQLYHNRSPYTFHPNNYNTDSMSSDHSDDSSIQSETSSAYVVSDEDQSPLTTAESSSNTVGFIHPKHSIDSRQLDELDPREHPNRMSPDDFIAKLFEILLGFTPQTRPTLDVSPLHYDETSEPFIRPISDENQANYDTDVVTATREEDLDTLRSLHAGGQSLSCCNRFGESLLHMACRRGFASVFSFLIEEAGVSIRITDDCGRTPLHDALWHRECQYGIVDMLVRSDPSLLFLCDKHGHTPFAYSRREHWEVWKQFLWDRREHMKEALNMNVMELFRSEI